MIRPSYFIWVIVPIALYLVYMAWGSPHIAFNYTWRNDGQGYDPFAKRWYLSCEYIGATGSHQYHPQDGKCPWFRFYKHEERANEA